MSNSPRKNPILSYEPFTTVSSSRLQALYSDIARQKQSNPTSFHSSMAWWRKALEVIVSSGLQTDTNSRLVLKAGMGLMERTRIEGVGKPLALGAVISELRAGKALFPRNEFLNAQDPIYDAGWLPGRIVAFVVGKPLWWALEQVGVVGEEGLLGAGGSPRGHKDTSWWGEYVLVSLVEQAASRVLEKQEMKTKSSGDRLYSFDGFRQEFGSLVGVEGALSEGDAMVLLKFLERDKKAVLYDKDVVKFFIDDPLAAREINAVDKGILELRGAVQNLHAQVDGLQQKMDECTQKASAALQQKRKEIGLSHLRLRKQLEDLLSKRLGSLDNLESTLLRVEAAAEDIQIIKSYETSTSTLRAILTHPSLQRESIEATMNALAEVNSDAKEVDEAVRMETELAVGGSGVASDAELEEALKALVVEVEQEGKVKEEEVRGKLREAGKAPSSLLKEEEAVQERRMETEVA